MARIAVLTASTLGARGEREDTSGDAIVERCMAAGHSIAARTILADDRGSLAETMREWCDGRLAEIVITTGGTGLTAHDVTPEATRDIAERDVPGLPILLATEGLKKTPFAVLSRGIAVTRKSTLVINLPGNPRAVNEGLDVLLPLFDHIAKLLDDGPTEHRTDADTGHALRSSNA